MTRRILGGYLGLTALVLVMLTLPLGFTLAARERDQLRTAVERDARVLAAEADDAFENNDMTSLPELVDRYVRQTGGRVVMVDRTGRSVIDSSDPNGSGRDFSTRPEVASALAGKFTSGERSSTTLGTGLLYVAVPISHEQGVLGVVRVSYPTTTVDRRVREVWLKLLGLNLMVTAVASAVGWQIARTLARPILALERAADALAEGDLSARVPAQSAPPDLVRVADTFNAMGDRLQTLIESRQSFLADASHQLRTPLTALRLRLESVASTLEEPTADLTAASNEVDRLSDLVDALLSMARLDAQPGAVVATPVATIAAERVETWATLADEQGVALHFVDHTAGAGALVVEGGLEQILDNLIDNALEHHHTSGNVTVEVAGLDDDVTVTVTDDGPGVPDEHLRRIFDRFWRGPGAGPGGTGLGLAIVQRLTEASGGSVSARRPDGGGLEIELRLPRTSSAPGPRP